MRSETHKACVRIDELRCAQSAMGKHIGQFARVLFVFICPCSLRLPIPLKPKIENEALRFPTSSFWRKGAGGDTEPVRGHKVSRHYSRIFFDGPDSWFIARFVKCRIIRRYSLIKRAIAVSLLSCSNLPQMCRTIALQSWFFVVASLPVDSNMCFRFHFDVLAEDNQARSTALLTEERPLDASETVVDEYDIAINPYSGLLFVYLLWIQFRLSEHFNRSTVDLKI